MSCERCRDELDEVEKELEETKASAEFWKKDSATAWDRCEERRLEAETLRKILRAVGVLLETIIDDATNTEREIKIESIKGVVDVIEAALASSTEPS
jgi:MarR-like DNA-binding transcriptional regulator SgrR of sgrS sRNA